MNDSNYAALALALSALITTSACGSDAPPGMAPENPVRSRGASGLEEPPPLVMHDAGMVDVRPVEELPCCDVTFAIAADQEDGELSALLLGYDLPLVDGVPLERVDGRWQGTACIPHGFDGLYYYEVALDVGTGEPFFVRRINETVQLGSNADATNALVVAEMDCPAELEAHASVGD